jgi:serine/threonine-protein kinase
MATVSLGRLVGPNGFAKTVAIKRLHPAFAKDPDFAAMFIDEARLAARVRHPNVVQMLDVIAVDEELFLVLEYCHGEPLSRLLRSRGDGDGYAPVDVVSSVVCGVLHGLHAAHEATTERGEPLELVHRDVSPQNILVGVEGAARLIDFGVAKAAGRCHTTIDGKVRGKLAYMAPEQLRGEQVDRRADVYSAGVVLWEMLTGRALFKGENEAATIANVLFGRVPRPSSLRPELSRELDELTLRALERRRVRRFETARQMALALEQCLPPASGARVGTWVESIAGDVLAERAAAIARIEEVSASPGKSVRSRQEPGPLVFDSTGSQLFSQVKAAASPARPRTLAAGALMGALFIAGISWALALRTTASHASGEPRISVEMAPATTFAPAPTGPQQVATSPAIGAPQLDAGAESAPATLSPAVRELGQKKRALVRPVAPAKAAASAICAVRSYFDVDGIKQYEQVCP